MKVAESMHNLQAQVTWLLHKHGFKLSTFYYSQAADDPIGVLSIHADRDRERDKREAAAGSELIDTVPPAPSDADYPSDLADREPIYDFSGSIVGKAKPQKPLP